MVRAVVLKQILWPQRQEDRNEGGWLQGDERLRSEDRARETLIRRAHAARHTWRETDWELKNRTPQFDETEDRADYMLKERGHRPTRGRTSTSHA
jgi:hypothetical protein